MINQMDFIIFFIYKTNNNMNPKEKAIELIELFQLAPDGQIFIMSNDHSKKCALLAVDELLSVMEYPSGQYLFYLQVKKEITKLD